MRGALKALLIVALFSGCLGPGSKGDVTDAEPSTSSDPRPRDALGRVVDPPPPSGPPGFFNKTYGANVTTLRQTKTFFASGQNCFTLAATGTTNLNITLTWAAQSQFAQRAQILVSSGGNDTTYAGPSPLQAAYEPKSSAEGKPIVAIYFQGDGAVVRQALMIDIRLRMLPGNNADHNPFTCYQ
ncbi:MAG TPA: hypothetical protein VI818_08280 [Candidatus Thermoplasmatota archaeon]|nr:hypothetical protein [Candidatus Thermoplasmatota archaeon]